MNQRQRRYYLLALCLLPMACFAGIETYTTSCSSTSDEITCLGLIDGNVGQNQYNTDAIYDILTDDFDYGDSAFYGTSTPASDTSSSTDLTSAISEIEYYAVADRFSVLLLPWLGATDDDDLETLAVSTSDDDFADQINTISNAHGLYGGDDGASGLSGSDYYSSAALYDQGVGRIEYYDVKPYSFPPTAQILRNELGQTSMTQFLLNVGTSTDETTYLTSDEATSYYENCPQYNVTSDNDDYYGLDGENYCYMPWVQNNVISYNGSSTYDPETEDTYSIDVPSYDVFFKGNIDTAVLPSLNVDSLINPLTYSTDIDSQLSSDESSRHEQLGLHGDSQLTMADSFIRYVSGSLLANTFSSRTTYDDYYDLATDTSGDSCLQYRLDAALKIKSYRQLIRYYAAQKSVGVSNLYYLMAKRMPNNSDDSDTDNHPSLEQQEARMATYRIFSSSDGSQSTPEWQTRLQNASSAEIQRQIAMLLAEMNYQLYLNRKEQERILMTLSVMHIQSINEMKNSITLDNASSNVSSASAAEGDACGDATSGVSTDDS